LSKFELEIFIKKIVHQYPFLRCLEISEKNELEIENCASVILRFLFSEKQRIRNLVIKFQLISLKIEYFITF